MLSIVLVFVLLAAVLPSAHAEGLLGYLDELGMDGSQVPSFARWMGREPDNQRVREDGCIVQQFRTLGGNANWYDFFMNLKSIGCSVGRLHWENGGALQFITAVYDGNVFTISYRPDTDTVEIAYPPASKIAILEPMFPEDGGFALAGKSVLFGSYEQDDDLSNDSEPIEWVIVDQAGERVLLLSRRILDVQAYNAVDDAAAPATTWEGSTLRAWLNGAFMKDAFTESERGSILLSEVDVRTRHQWMDGPNGQVWGSYEDDTQGNNTQDYVFVPASEVYHGFFDNGSSDTFEATPYAAAQAEGDGGALITGGYLCFATSTVAPPRPGGSVGVVEIAIGQQNILGSDVTARTGVRPMLWLDLSEEGAHWY